VLYFTHLPTSPHGRICTKFGIGVVAVDVITLAIFRAISLGTSILCGVENGGFPLTKPLAVNTLLTRLRSE